MTARARDLAVEAWLPVIVGRLFPESSGPAVGGLVP